MNPEDQAIHQRILAREDRQFAELQDPLLALKMVRRAAFFGLPMPPNVAEWLYARHNEYVLGKAESLDAALGLASKQGQHHALKRMRKQERWYMPLAFLDALASLGAAIDDAAALVAREFAVSASGLARKYRDGNLEARRKEMRECWRSRPDDVERILGRYPDDTLSRPVKDRIRAKLKR